MIGVPRQIKGPKPWPLHPWMVSFYDGNWRCQVGVLRDKDYSSGSNERTFSSYTQNVRQNFTQFQRGNVGNEKGATSNPKTFALNSPTWTGGNKLYCNYSGNGMGVPTSPQLVPDDGCVKWGSGAFSSIQETYVFLRKLAPDDTQDVKWCVIAQSGGVTWEEDDIVIAKIEPTGGSQTGWMVAQVLKSDVFFGKGGGTTSVNHPFKITRNANPQVMTFSVSEGTVNNVAVGLSSSSLGNVGVWLKTYPSLGIAIFNSAPSTDDTQAWLQIGRITHVPKVPADGTYVTTIYQYVKNSIWLERFKCGSDPAQYWYSQI